MRIGSIRLNSLELRRPLLALGLVWLVLSGCATNPVTGKQDLAFISEREEIALGEQFHPQIIRAYGVYQDAELQQYVNSIGQRLAAQSHRPHLEYHFTVLDDDSVNAFALPGGYIYITRGILAYLNSEAELAAVLGHEIGHVTARHAVQQQSQSKLLGVLSAVAGAATGTAATTSLGNVFGGALLKGYGRSHELQADELGAEYLARTEYPTEAMIEVIDVLRQREKFEIDRAREEGREPRVYHGWFASHPDNDTRLREVVDKAKSYETGNADLINREVFLQRIDGMRWGQGGQSGVVRNNDYFNSQLGIKISFPDDWQLQSQKGKILAAAPREEALLQVSTMPLDKSLRPRDFLLHKVKVRGLRDGKEITVDGMPGYLAVAERAESPFGKRPVRYAVIYDHSTGQAYVFAGAGKFDSTEIAADRQFIPTIFSLGKLTPDEYRLARPAVVRVVSVPPGTTIEALAAQSPIGQYSAQELRLLNDLYPDGEPQPGQLLKIVQ